MLRVNAATPGEIERGIGTVISERPDAMIIPPSAYFIGQRSRIVHLAAEHRLPTMYAYREDVLAGGLISYGQNLADYYRRAASYVDKILKGAKPGDLPVEQPTRLELVINLKTAKALGITVPQLMLLRADELIQ